MTTKITVNSKGSLRVEGEFELFDESGAQIDVGGRNVIGLCRCGKSAKSPFCDGAHKSCDFNAPPVVMKLEPR